MILLFQILRGSGYGNLLSVQRVAGWELFPYAEVNRFEQAGKLRLSGELAQFHNGLNEGGTRHGQTMFSGDFVLSLLRRQERLRGGGSAAKRKMPSELLGVRADGGYELVGAWNENGLGPVAGKPDHEPHPFLGMRIGIGAQVSLAVDGFESRLMGGAINTGNRDTTARQVPHQYNAC
jgi:hypothetical protein